MKLGVDKVYVINLKRHKKRKQSILDISKDKGFDFEFVEGYDNQDYRDNPEFFKNINNKFWDPAGRCTLAILCCAMSHRKAYKAFLDSGAETALFLEDDVETTKSFDEFDFKDMEVDLASLDWGVCWYGKYTEKMVVRNKITKQLHDYEYHHGGQYAGHAYALNRKSAQWFYDNTEKIKYAADVRLEFSPFKQITVGKSLFIQKHIHQYISGEDVDKEFMHFTLEDTSWWRDLKWDENNPVHISEYMIPKDYYPSKRGFKVKRLDGWEFLF